MWKLCMKFVHLVLRKIFKFVATRCQILRPKCTRFNFRWGSAPDPTGGAYSVPPDLLAGFKGPTFGVGNGRVGGVEGRGGKRQGPQGLLHIPISENPENTLIAELI